jgi:hypothetical protein
MLPFSAQRKYELHREVTAPKLAPDCGSWCPAVLAASAHREDELHTELKAVKLTLIPNSRRISIGFAQSATEKPRW